MKSSSFSLLLFTVFALTVTVEQAFTSPFICKAECESTIVKNKLFGTDTSYKRKSLTASSEDLDEAVSSLQSLCEKEAQNLPPGWSIKNQSLVQANHIYYPLFDPKQDCKKRVTKKISEEWTKHHAKRLDVNDGEDCPFDRNCEASYREAMKSALHRAKLTCEYEEKGRFVEGSAKFELIPKSFKTYEILLGARVTIECSYIEKTGNLED